MKIIHLLACGFLSAFGMMLGLATVQAAMITPRVSIFAVGVLLTVAMVLIILGFGLFIYWFVKSKRENRQNWQN